MNSSLSQPNPYSRYQAGAGKASPAGRSTAAGSASCSSQYHRYRYGRHARTPRDPDGGQS